MIPGFEVIPATSPGGSFNGSPWKLVIHSTEGSSIDGAVGAYRSHGGWPHFTVDPARKRKTQHYELNVSSRALAHPAGTPETNRAGAINVEVVGFAAQVHAWSQDWLTWLALEVFAPIRAVCPFALAAPLFVRYPDSYGTGAAQRFTRSEWATYSGIVGHQHCPDNDHGDPGALDVTAILAALGGVPPKPPILGGSVKVHLWLADTDTGENPPDIRAGTVFVVTEDLCDSVRVPNEQWLADAAYQLGDRVLAPKGTTKVVNGVTVEVVGSEFLRPIVSR